MSKARKGTLNPMYGKKHTEETRQKLSEILSGENNPMFGKGGKDSPNYGKPRSDEIRQKISKSHKGIRPSEETRKKMSTSQRGIDLAQWNGFCNNLQVKIRTSIKYKTWRKECFIRDHYTCQFCFKHGGNLEADHVKPFALILKENNIASIEEAEYCQELWNIDNGRTLCTKCHKQTDTYGHKTTKILDKVFTNLQVKQLPVIEEKEGNK